MDRKLFIFLIVGLVLVGVFILIRGEKDTWLCQNCQWVKHGLPSSPKPTEPCCEEPPQTEPTIVVFSPQPNQIIQSPLVIEGKARGTWFFEAVFPTRLLDDKGEGLAVSYAQATEDWMTEDFVPFQGELKFLIAATTSGRLVLEKANPSDLPEYAEQFEIPLLLSPSETMKVKAYFNNDRLDPEFSCNKVFPIERDIIKIKAVARAALEELLKGPTEKEKAEGFFTSINPGVTIQQLVIENGTAKVDFDEQLEYQVGGSCRVAAIRTQITETLKQFSTVDKVIISIDGRTEDILQP